MKKKCIGIMLTVILLFSCIFAAVPSYAAVTDLPELTGQSAILINADTGEVLYDKYKDFQTYPASTTKVMTARWRWNIWIWIRSAPSVMMRRTPREAGFSFWKENR